MAPNRTTHPWRRQHGCLCVGMSGDDGSGRRLLSSKWRGETASKANANGNEIDEDVEDPGNG